MYYLLGKHKVKDLAAWKDVITADTKAHAEAGIHFQRVWTNLADPEQIFFLFAVDDPDRARVFLDRAGALDKNKQASGEIPELFFVTER